VLLIAAKVREIRAKEITDAVAQLCQRANFELEESVLAALKQAQQNEPSPLGKEILRQLIDNARVAEAKNLPLCQDCGSAVIFLEVGQDAHVIDGDLNEAVSGGVVRATPRDTCASQWSTSPFPKGKTPAITRRR